jgi:hypothetical protein
MSDEKVTPADTWQEEQNSPFPITIGSVRRFVKDMGCNKDTKFTKIYATFVYAKYVDWCEINREKAVECNMTFFHAIARECEWHYDFELGGVLNGDYFTPRGLDPKYEASLRIRKSRTRR